MLRTEGTTGCGGRVSRTCSRLAVVDQAQGGLPRTGGERRDDVRNVRIQDGFRQVTERRLSARHGQRVARAHLSIHSPTGLWHPDNLPGVHSGTPPQRA